MSDILEEAMVILNALFQRWGDELSDEERGRLSSLFNDAWDRIRGAPEEARHAEVESLLGELRAVAETAVPRAGGARATQGPQGALSRGTSAISTAQHQVENGPVPPQALKNIMKTIIDLLGRQPKGKR